MSSANNRKKTPARKNYTTLEGRTGVIEERRGDGKHFTTLNDRTGVIEEKKAVNYKHANRKKTPKER